MKKRFLKGISLFITASMLVTTMAFPAWADETEAYESQAVDQAEEEVSEDLPEVVEAEEPEEITESVTEESAETQEEETEQAELETVEAVQTDAEEEVLTASASEEECTHSNLGVKDASIEADGTLSYTVYCKSCETTLGQTTAEVGEYEAYCNHFLLKDKLANDYFYIDPDEVAGSDSIQFKHDLRDKNDWSIDADGTLHLTVYCYNCSFAEDISLQAGDYDATYYPASCTEGAYTAVALKNDCVTLSNGQVYFKRIGFENITEDGSEADPDNHQLKVSNIEFDEDGNLVEHAACGCGKVTKDFVFEPDEFNAFNWHRNSGEWGVIYYANVQTTRDGQSYQLLLRTPWYNGNPGPTTWHPGIISKNVTVSNAYYTGKAIKPTVTIKDLNGNKIDAANYTVSYSNNTKVGTAKVTITFKENYFSIGTAVIEKTFKILPKATAISSLKSTAKGIKITWKKVTGATGYRVYRGSKLIATIKKNATVSYVDTAAKKNGTKYTYKVVAIASGVGKAKASAAKSAYYMTAPTIKSVTNSASKTMTVKWSKNAKATGYQVLYKVGSTSKKVTVKSAATLKKVIKSLKKGKTYKVYVRSYKKVSGTTYVSAWSSVKSLKISK